MSQTQTQTPSAAGLREPNSILRYLRPEFVYLAAALVFGGALLVLTPPFQSPDEDAHLRRAYALAEGHFLLVKQGKYTGDFQPSGLTALRAAYTRLQRHTEEKTTASEILATGTISTGAEDREFAAFSNAAVHPPLVYLPQAVAVFFARILRFSPLVYLYVGRLANLLAATAVTFLAVRLTPIGKWALSAFALAPTPLFLSATLSPDALTNAFAFLFLAQVLACALGPAETVSGWSLACLAALGAAIALSKQAYFLLPASYLLIPIARMGTWRRYAAGLTLVCGVTLLFVTAWGLIMRSTYSPPDPAMDIDAAARIRNILHDPIGFVGVVLRTATRWQLILEQYLGFLGLFDVRLARWLWLCELVVLALVCAHDFGPASGITVRQALVSAAVAGAVCLTVLIVVYATWDRPGAPWIAVQGRYFIPAGPLAGIALGRVLGSVPVGWQRLSRVEPLAASAAFGLLLTATLVRVHDRYFVDNDKAAAHRSFNRGVALQRAGAGADKVREAFEEAVRLDPDHYLAHSNLGQILKESNPHAAAEHFRAVLRQLPGDVASLTNLANALYLERDFPEAIRLCREAVRLAPDDPNMRKNLAQAVQANEAMENTLRQVSAVLPTFAAESDMLETRYRGTAKEGRYFKPSRGRIVDASGRVPFPEEFRWRCPPPSGDAIGLSGLDVLPSGQAGRMPFYACSAALGVTRRIFVFPPPRGAVLVPDADISWFFQVPLVDLNEAEASQERDYRARIGLQFPLTKIPE
jgi:uncharacterized membrane protein